MADDLLPARLALALQAGVCAAMLAAAPAAAGEAAANVGAASDYVFRGVSQTDGKPQVSGGVDGTAGRAYGGLWASNVDYRDGTNAEVDLYGGVRPTVGPWTVDLGAIAYLYPGQPDGADYDYVEAKLGASREVGPATFAATAWWSPDFFGTEREATYLEVGLRLPVGDRWSASGALGRQEVSSDADYATWNLGLTWAATPAVALDLRYSDTDAHDLGDAFDGRAVVGVKATF